MNLFRYFIPVFLLTITLCNASGQAYQFAVMPKQAPMGNGTIFFYSPVKKNERPLPNKRQLAWQNEEMGVLISYDLHVFDSKRYVQRENRIAPIPDYNIFSPKHLDTEQRGYNGRHEWFWEPGDESHIFPVKQLMDMYLQSVGHNSTLILGITPDTSGLIPQPDVERMKAFGEAIRKRFAKPLVSASGENRKIILTLPHPKVIHDIVLMEDISKGERVRQFSVEGFKNGKWITLLNGTCIGHKLIIPVNEKNLNKLRLRIIRANGLPHMLTFSVF